MADGEVDLPKSFGHVDILGQLRGCQAVATRKKSIFRTVADVINDLQQVVGPLGKPRNIQAVLDAATGSHRLAKVVAVEQLAIPGEHR